MGKYAEIIGGKVARVLVVDGTEAEALKWLKDNVSTELWVKTAEDGSIRGKFAGVGDEYYTDIDVFIKKPFKSWTLDKNLKMYLPPLPKPLAVPIGFAWFWVEKVGAWIKRRLA